MGVVLAVANQKGGVGKTTTSINLSASLASMNKRVLLVDLDPQGNATSGSGVDKNQLQVTLYDLLVNDQNIDDVIVPVKSAGYDLIGCNTDLTGAEIALQPKEGRESLLSQMLNQVRGRYHFIIIDCPPALGLLTVNGLIAADGVIIPMQCEYYAMEGLTALVSTISRIAATHNQKLKIEGVVRTMYDPRNSLTGDVSEQLAEYFKDDLYQTLVPRNVRLAEAPSYGLPVLQYDKDSKGAKAYLALAGEVLKRLPPEAIKAAEID